MAPPPKRSSHAEREDVEARRKFIQENALDVKNLDVLSN